MLPAHREPFIKVKARHKKAKNMPLANAFNTAFANIYPNIFYRSIFCNTTERDSTGLERYYIFPINGYKFLYCNSVKNTTEAYKSAMLGVLDIMVENEAISLLSKVLEDDYVSENLHIALDKQSEVIIYNIPYFYAIKCSFFTEKSDYDLIVRN
jgi:hypothetical protein